MSKNLKKWLVATLRLVVCVVALLWVLHNVTYRDYVTLSDGSRFEAVDIRADTVIALDPNGNEQVIACANQNCEVDESISITYGLRTTWHSADKRQMIFALIVFIPVPIIQAWRFKLLLQAQDITVSKWEAVKLTYAGNFLNFITALGTTGGDVFKAYYVSLHTKRKTEAVTTVLLDRFIGLFGLLSLVALVILLHINDEKLAVLGYGLLVIALSTVLVAAVFFSKRIRARLSLGKLLDILPFAQQIRRAESAMRRLAKRKLYVAGAWLSTCILQVIAITSFIIAATALGMRSDATAIWDYYAHIGGGLVIAAIPISFQGLGTMEAFLKHMMLGSHGTLSAILCFAMILRLIMLFWSLPGVLVTMTGAYKPRVTQEEIQFA